MIVHPEERVADFAKAGSDIISVHAEPAATVHLDRTINQVGETSAVPHPVEKLNITDSVSRSHVVVQLH